MKKVLTMRATNSWMLICHWGPERGWSFHAGRFEKRQLERRHWKRRVALRPPMAMLQASDCPAKWGSEGMRRLRGAIPNGWIGGGEEGLEMTKVTSSGMAKLDETPGVPGSFKGACHIFWSFGGCNPSENEF